MKIQTFDLYHQDLFFQYKSAQSHQNQLVSGPKERISLHIKLTLQKLRSNCYNNFDFHPNLQERKRRDHIKDSFTGLKDAIPSLQARQGDKCSRAQILKKVGNISAVSHILVTHDSEKYFRLEIVILSHFISRPFL